MTKEEFIIHLTAKNRFVRYGPRTFMYCDKRDTLTVFVNENIVSLTLDGKHTIPTQDMIKITDGQWNNALQFVLEKF